MNPAIYNVIDGAGRWTVSVNHRDIGSYATERQAVRMAIEAAQEAGRYNLIGAQVVVHAAHAKERLVWTYGQPVPAASGSR